MARVVCRDKDVPLGCWTLTQSSDAVHEAVISELGKKVPVLSSPAHCLHVCPMEQFCGALFQNILWILGSNHLPFCQIEQGWCIRKVRKNGAHPLLITML